MKSGIYSIANTSNGKCYIGSAVSIENRWAVHRHGLNRGIHHSVALQRAWEKYGPEMFKFEVLEYVQELSKLVEREQYWIDCYITVGLDGYNICKQAGSSMGRKFSEAAKEKMRAAKLGKPRSAEARAKQSATTRGTKKSESHRLAIGAAQKGRPCSDALKSAVAKANKARIHSAETRAKLSAAAKKGNALRAYAWGSDRGVVWSEPKGSENAMRTG